MNRDTLVKYLPPFEKGFTVFSLLIYSGAFLSLIASGGGSEGDSGVSFQAASTPTFVLLIFQVIYLITFFLLSLRWRDVLWILIEDKLIVLITVFAIFSAIWSTDYRITLVRCVALIGTSLLGLYLATRFSLREQLQLLGYVFGIVVVFSFLIAIAMPQYGIMSGIHEGAWRGVYVHKNVLGKMMVLSSVVFFLQTDRKENRMINLAGLGLSIVLLLLSTSFTSLLSLVILLTSTYIVRVFRWQYDFMIPGILGISVIGLGFYFLVMTNYDVLLSSVGKDATLTGRTDLWPLVTSSIERHPWLGYGYGAFWENTNSEAVRIRYAAGWDVPNAHSGFLDVWADVGIVGLTILMLSFLKTKLKAWLLIRKTAALAYIWPLLFLLNTVMANLSETTLLVRNDIFWVLYIAVTFSVLSSSLSQTTNLQPTSSA